jgi:hypothetical protein
MKWLKGFWKSLTTPAVADRKIIGPFPPAPSEEIFCNFTPRAQQVLVLARQEADQLNHNFVGTEHLLLGLMRLGQGVAVNVLQKLGVKPDELRSQIIKHVGVGPGQTLVGHLLLTPRVKRVLALADKERKALHHTYLGTEHLLLGLIREGDGVAARVLAQLEIDLVQVRQEILKELDPNFALDYSRQPSNLPEETSPTTSGAASAADAVAPEKRYDVYCVEAGDRQVVYRNVRFKGIKRISPEQQQSDLEDFHELEQADGQVIYVAKFSIIKFCEAGATPGPENPPEQ